MVAFYEDKEGAEELLYDHFKIITSLDLNSDFDILYMNVLNFKLDIDSNYGQKTKPVRNTMGLTVNEYREFLSTYSYSMNSIKNWLNENIYSKGIYMPFTVKEFLTNINFQEGSIHFLLEVFEDSYEYFDDQF